MMVWIQELVGHQRLVGDVGVADERRDWQWRHIHLSADPIAPITDVIVVEQIRMAVVRITAGESLIAVVHPTVMQLVRRGGADEESDNQKAASEAAEGAMHISAPIFAGITPAVGNAI